MVFGRKQEKQQRKRECAKCNVCYYLKEDCICKKLFFFQYNDGKQ